MAARLVAGVDLSTRRVSAVLVGRGERVRATVEVDDAGGTAEERFAPLVRAFAQFLLAARPTEVYVESLPFVKSRASIVGLASIFGAVRAACVLDDVKLALVPGYEWKKGLDLDGRDKAAVRRWAESRGAPVEHWSQDLADAYAIAVYGWRWRGAA